jgi:hypothetical protein
VSDRLYLSCWIRGFSESNMLQHFETLVSLFPYSKLAQRGPLLRVYAIERVEPPILEREFPPGPSAEEIAAYAAELTRGDCAVEVEAAWDLWQHDGEDWKLGPAPVTLVCSGPDFDNENGDHLRIEFGLDSRFLPIEGLTGSLRMGQSNLRSLLHLVSQVETALPVERRKLWSESGANFAENLVDTLSRFDVH